MLSIVISALMLQVRPPFVRAWTHLTPEFCKVLEVSDGKVWFASKAKVGALDVTTGKPIWEKSPSNWMNPFAIDARWIYAVDMANQKFTVLRIDRSSGASRQIYTSKHQILDIASNGQSVFVLVSALTVRALDPVSGKQEWTAVLQKGVAEGVSLSSILATRQYVHVGAENERMCLSAATGKILWKQAGASSYQRPVPLPNQQIVVENEAGTSRQDLATGKVFWSRPHHFEDMGISNGMLVGDLNGDAAGIDLETGNTIWTVPGADDMVSLAMARRLNLVTSDGVWLSSADDDIRVFRADGTLAWRAPNLSSELVALESGTLICQEDQRILAYRHGERPALPQDEARAKALAMQLVRDFEMLDKTEREDVTRLARYTFKPMLDNYVKWALEYGEDEEMDEVTVHDYYKLLDISKEILSKSFQRENTDDVVDALKALGPKSGFSAALENILLAKGDEAKFIPLLIEKVRGGASSGMAWEASTVEIVAASRHPQAVAFMLEALQDPKANEQVRQEAFRHLAETGGAAGIAAVLAARAKPGPRAPWWEAVKPDPAARRDKPVTKTDAQGRTWTRFSHSALGHGGDQYMVGVDGKPIYLGFFVGEVFRGEAPQTYRGLPISKLIADEWITLFPDDAEIRKDADADGLTDLVEARLGTDPAKADTDGDGLTDTVDPCPDAAPRPMGDTEKIIAAAVEARFFGEDWKAPAVLEAPGVEPFELYGYPRTLMWRSAGLGAIYGGGANMIGFRSPDERGGPMIQFGPDRKTATTLISRYSGGLNGDGTVVSLKKVEEEWFVVGMRIAFLS